MPKSGSPLAFELARTILCESGIPQPKLPYGIVDSKHEINFIKNLNRTILEAADGATSSWEPPLIIKTHSKLQPFVRKGLRRGRIIGHAVFRDPRDIALSMMDAAKEGRAWGDGPNGTFRSIRETIPVIRKHLEHFQDWAECAGILPLRYELVAFNMVETCVQLAKQLGTAPDIQKIIHTVTKQRFTQLNQGVPSRWKRELSSDDARAFGEEFAPFLDRFCLDVTTGISGVEEVPNKAIGRLLGTFFSRK